MYIDKSLSNHSDYQNAVSDEDLQALFPIAASSRTESTESCEAKTEALLGKLRRKLSGKGNFERWEAKAGMENHICVKWTKTDHSQICIDPTIAQFASFKSAFSVTGGDGILLLASLANWQKVMREIVFEGRNVNFNKYRPNDFNFLNELAVSGMPDDTSSSSSSSEAVNPKNHTKKKGCCVVM